MIEWSFIHHMTETTHQRPKLAALISFDIVDLCENAKLL